MAHGELAYLAECRNDFAEMRRQLDAAIGHALIFATVPRDEGGHDRFELQLHLIEIQGLMTQERYAEGDAAVGRAQHVLASMLRPSVRERIFLNTLHSRARRQLGDLDVAAALPMKALRWRRCPAFRARSPWR